MNKSTIKSFPSALDNIEYQKKKLSDDVENIKKIIDGIAIHQDDEIENINDKIMICKSLEKDISVLEKEIRILNNCLCKLKLNISNDRSR